MRTRSTLALLAATLAGFVPAAAAAFEYAGELGGGYDRVESWQGPSAQYSLVPRLRLYGNLAMADYVVDPGVVDWTLRGGYDEGHSTYGGTAEKNSALTYAAYLGILQTRESRAQVSASASRTRSDFSTDTEAVRQTGTTLSNSYTVNSGVGIPGLPALTASFGHHDSVSSGLGRPDATEAGQALDLSLLSGQPGLTNTIRYGMRWESGSLVPANYTSQFLSLSSMMAPADRVQGSVNVNYYRRDPTVLNGLNPRYEGTSGDASVNWDDGWRRVTGSYHYGHDTATDPLLQLREQNSNVISAALGLRTSKELEWITSASGAYSQTRLGTAQISASGESVGLGLNWNRGLLGANLTARAGGLQPETGPSQLAYGATAGGNTGWDLPRHTVRLSYTAGYASNLDAREGWSTTQSAFVDLGSRMPGFLSWTLRLQGLATRGDGGLLGPSAQRTLTAMADVRYRRASFRLDAGITEAVTGALSNPVSDGLFIPPGYNTHSRYAGLTVSVPLGFQLTALGFTRYTVLTAPGTPDQQEAQVGGSLRYTVGYWSLSLDDRYTTGGSNSFDRRVNELYVRLVRAFGGR